MEEGGVLLWYQQHKTVRVQKYTEERISQVSALCYFAHQRLKSDEGKWGKKVSGVFLRTEFLKGV